MKNMTPHEALVDRWEQQGTGETVAKQLADLQRGSELMAINGMNHGDSGNTVRLIDRPDNANEKGEWKKFIDKQGKPYEVTRLRGKFFATTNSGEQVANAIHNPDQVFSIHEIHPDGDAYRHVSGANNPTSEMVSHLYGLDSTKGRIASAHGHLLPHNAFMAVPGMRPDFHDHIMATALESGAYIPGGIGVIEQVVPGNKDFAERIAAVTPPRDLGKAAIVAWWGHGIHAMGDSLEGAAARLLEVKQQFIVAKDLLLGPIGEIATVVPETYAGVLDQFNIPMPAELRAKILDICDQGRVRIEDLVPHMANRRDRKTFSTPSTPVASRKRHHPKVYG